MLRNAALASSVVASMPIVLPLTNPASASRSSTQREDGAMRLQIDQPARPGDRRVIRRGLRQRQAEKIAHGQRIGRAPRDPALRVDALEVADQQQPEVQPGRQARPAHRRGVERRACASAKSSNLCVSATDSVARRTDDRPPSADPWSPPTSAAAGRVCVCPSPCAESVVRPIAGVDPITRAGRAASSPCPTFTTGC